MLFIQDALEHEHAYASSFYLPVMNVRRNKDELLAALAAVYDVSATDACEVVSEKINHIRRLAINRVYDLARFALRMPVRGLILDPRYCDIDRLYRGFKACVRCRPSGLIYPPRLPHKRFRSCKSDHFCPACWARVMAVEYQLLLQAFQKTLATAPDVTAHLISFRRAIDFPEISSADFTTPEVFSSSVDKLVAAFDMLHGSVYRDTRRFWPSRGGAKYKAVRGSYWRVVPVPTPRGITLQYRRVVLSTSDHTTTSPIPRYTMSSRRILVSPKSVHTAAKSVLSFVSSYPHEYLTEDLELTGVCLNAVGGRRCADGSGLLRGVNGTDAKRRSRKR